MSYSKNYESRLKKDVYENISLLTAIFEPTEAFKSVFTRDMFDKNNKAGFFEVVHYLLNILNSELTRKRLTSWPPYDLKVESKFRAELVNYLKEINTLYDANVPPLMTSHMISPGGMRIITFLSGLSQLVIYEYLRKNESTSTVLSKCRSNKPDIIDAYIKKITIQSNKIEADAKRTHDDFTRYHQAMQDEANRIKESEEELNLSLAELTQKCHNLEKLPEGAVEEMVAKLNNIIERLTVIDDIRKEMVALKELLYKVFEEHRHDHESKEQDRSDEHNPSVEMDLMQFMRKLRLFLEHAMIRLPHLPKRFLIDTKDALEDTVGKQRETLERLELLEGTIQDEAEKKSDFCMGSFGIGSSAAVRNIVSVDENDLEVLAVPLADSSRLTNID